MAHILAGCSACRSELRAIMDASENWDASNPVETAVATRIKEKTLQAFDQSRPTGLSKSAKDSIRDSRDHQVRISAEAEELVQQVVKLQREERAGWLEERISDELRVSVSLKLSRAAYLQRFDSAPEVRALGRLAQTVVLHLKGDWTPAHHDAIALGMLEEGNGLRLVALIDQAERKIARARSHIEAGTGSPSLRLKMMSFLGSAFYSEHLEAASERLGSGYGLAQLLNDTQEATTIQNIGSALDTDRKAALRAMLDLADTAEQNIPTNWFGMAAVHLNVASLASRPECFDPELVEVRLAKAKEVAGEHLGIQAWVLAIRSHAAETAGNLDLAVRLSTRALEKFAGTGKIYDFLDELLCLAELQIQRGDSAFARDLALKAIKLASDTETDSGVRESIEVWLKASLHERLDQAFVNKLRSTLSRRFRSPPRLS